MDRGALEAWVLRASFTKNTYLSAQYHRLAVRRGKKRAIGAGYFDRRRPHVTANRLLRRLESLGYRVTLQEQPVHAAA